MEEKEKATYRINWAFIKYMIVFLLGLLLINRFLVYNNLIIKIKTPLMKFLVDGGEGDTIGFLLITLVSIYYFGLLDTLDGSLLIKSTTRPDNKN